MSNKRSYILTNIPKAAAVWLCELTAYTTWEATWNGLPNEKAVCRIHYEDGDYIEESPCTPAFEEVESFCKTALSPWNIDINGNTPWDLIEDQELREDIFRQVFEQISDDPRSLTKEYVHKMDQEEINMYLHQTSTVDED